MALCSEISQKTIKNIHTLPLVQKSGICREEYTLKSKLRIAFLQLLPEETTEKNMIKGLKACREAKKQGADIALFPEMWSTGYQIKGTAISLDDDFLAEYKKLSAELEMSIGITFLEKTAGLPLNSIVVFDRKGNKCLHYSKVHTCDFGDEIDLERGDGFYVSELDTQAGMIKIGSMICYDREFPESARILMLEGAELILAPNACPMEINRLCALRTRAYENMVAVATCNYPEGMPDCNGHSTLFDGIPWLREEPCSRDMLVKDCSGIEGIYTADLNIDMLKKYRETECGAGNTFRRPKIYGKIMDEDVPFPFIRDNARR